MFLEILSKQAKLDVDLLHLDRQSDRGIAVDGLEHPPDMFKNRAHEPVFLFGAAPGTNPYLDMNECIRGIAVTNHENIAANRTAAN